MWIHRTVSFFSCAKWKAEGFCKNPAYTCELRKQLCCNACFGKPAPVRSSLTNSSPILFINITNLITFFRLGLTVIFSIFIFSLQATVAPKPLPDCAILVAVGSAAVSRITDPSTAIEPIRKQVWQFWILCEWIRQERILKEIHKIWHIITRSSFSIPVHRHRTRESAGQARMLSQALQWSVHSSAWITVSSRDKNISCPGSTCDPRCLARWRWIY